MQCRHELPTGTCSWCNGTPDSWSGNTAWDAGFPVESRVTVTDITDRIGRKTERPPLYERLAPFTPAVVEVELVRPEFVPSPRYVPWWVENAGASTTTLPAEPVEQVKRRDLPEYSDIMPDERRKAWGLAVKAGMLWDDFVSSGSTVEPENDEWYPMPSERAPDRIRSLRTDLIGGLSEWRAITGRRGGFAPPRSTLHLIGYRHSDISGGRFAQDSNGATIG